MADDLHAIVQRMIDAGEPEHNIALVIKSYQPQPVASHDAAPMTAAGEPMPDHPMGAAFIPQVLALGKRAVNWAKENPATAGAMAGATLATGGLGGMLEAGLYGAAGAGAGMVAKRLSDPSSQPLDVSDTLGTMATQGAGQAVMQGALGVAGKGAQGLGRGLYRVALRPSAAVRREFPGAMARGLEEGIPVTPRGTERAAALRGQSAQELQMALSHADAAGAPPVTAGQIGREGGFRGVDAKAALKSRLPGRAGEQGETRRLMVDFVQRNNQPMSLSAANPLKQSAQTEARQVFRAREAGHPVADTGALVDEAVAKGIRGSIERNARSVGVDVAPVNARTQDLMGLTEALETAEGRNHVLERLVGMGSGVSTAVMTGDPLKALASAGTMTALASPRALSYSGIASDRLGRAFGALPPNVLRGLLMAALTQGSDGQPDESNGQR